MSLFTPVNISQSTKGLLYFIFILISKKRTTYKRKIYIKHFFFPLLLAFKMNDIDDIYDIYILVLVTNFPERLASGSICYCTIEKITFLYIFLTYTVLDFQFLNVCVFVCLSGEARG